MIILQKSLRRWTRKQFPNQPFKGKREHLKQELLEWESETYMTPLNRKAEIMEAADCMMILLDMLSFRGISIWQVYRAMWRKLRINKCRKWNTPDSNGTVNHIRNN